MHTVGRWRNGRRNGLIVLSSRAGNSLAEFSQIRGILYLFEWQPRAKLFAESKIFNSCVLIVMR